MQSFEHEGLEEWEFAIQQGNCLFNHALQCGSRGFNVYSSRWQLWTWFKYLQKKEKIVYYPLKALPNSDEEIVIHYALNNFPTFGSIFSLGFSITQVVTNGRIGSPSATIVHFKRIRYDKAFKPKE